MRALHEALRIARAATGVSLWILSTIWLGARALWRATALAWRVREFFSKTTRCPRGHRVGVYGVHVCSACHGVIEGWVWRECPICGSRPAWTPCPRCGLSVRGPWR